MVRGPQAERLTTAVTGTEPTVVSSGANDWRRCSSLLETISSYLRNSSQGVRSAIGGETGPAVDAAFKKSAEAMTAKSQVLNSGSAALLFVSDAMQAAKDVHTTMQDMSAPTAYRAPVGNPTDEELQQQAQSKAKEKAFADAFAAQEEKARAAADALDEAFAKSTITMKEIHGEPDPPVVPPRKQQPGGSGGSAGGMTGGAVASPTIGGSGGAHGGKPDAHFELVQHPHAVWEPAGGGHHGDVDSGPIGSSGFPGTPIDDGQFGGPGSAGHGGLGTAGATAGGMAAGLIGAKLSGALKGGLFPTSGGGAAGTAGTAGRGTAASAVRGIGSSARTGGAGTIGRSGAPAGSGGTAGRAGAGGAGRSGSGGAGRAGSGATGRSGAGGKAGSGAGGRSSAGGRSGAGASGRSGRGKDDEKGRKRELFDVGEDWVDDEGAAPGVLG